MTKILSMSNTLRVIPIQGEIITLEYKPEDLSYGCPPFKSMYELIGEGCDCIEHVTIWWQGRAAHMFVDEVGLLVGKVLNARATGIYLNATLHRRGRDELLYKDLAQIPTDGMLMGAIAAHTVIVGTALLWEGDME